MKIKLQTSYDRDPRFDDSATPGPHWTACLPGKLISVPTALAPRKLMQCGRIRLQPASAPNPEAQYRALIYIESIRVHGTWGFVRFME